MFKPKVQSVQLTRPVLSWPAVTLLTSLFIVLFDNRLFWHALIDKLGPESTAEWGLMAVFGLTLTLLLNLVFSLFAGKWTLKPLLVLILLLCANVSYYADSFGIIVDPTMIHNILETNVAEASELLTWPLLWHLVVYAAIPSVLVLLTRVRYFGWQKTLLLKTGVLLGSVALVAGLALANYKEITFFGRENHDLQMYINPTYAIHSLKKVVKTAYFSNTDEPPHAIAEHATHAEDNHRQVVVLVLGETARSQSFSLNGYQQDTNPRLSKEDIVNFQNVASCGTATAESLPCMFSPQEHDNYSRSAAMSSENLLDLLEHAGVKVIWRDNDAGSKGVAKRVVYEDLSHQSDPQLCREDGCYDEILLQGLESLITSTEGDTLIVLHTQGSHGPSYYKRTPPEFKMFLPECAQDNVQDCPQQEIVNAYDNTIVYTDYLLSEVIELLKSQDLGTAMLYISDHGESLGENGLYLHGLPYALAPAEQTRVPMVFWASDKFFTETQIDRSTLLQERQGALSHDNLFHSVLGLFNVQTEIYKPELDIFAASHRAAPSRQG